MTDGRVVEQDKVEFRAAPVWSKSFNPTLTPAFIMPPRYLFHFAQAHNEFRLPEIQSIAELHGISYILSENPEFRNPTRPYMVIEIEEDDARTLAKRCILIKYLMVYYLHYRLNLSYN